MTTHRAVSEKLQHGETIDIPESAKNVTIEPDSGWGVKVTYLERISPLRRDS